MSLTVFPPLLAELWEAMYHTFFSFSRLCWSFDLTWRSWNFKSFPINGRVSFSPLSIMVLAASNTYKEGNTIIRKGDILQALIQSISDKRTAWCFMFSDICLDARTGHCWPNTRKGNMPRATEIEWFRYQPRLRQGSELCAVVSDSQNCAT